MPYGRGYTTRKLKKPDFAKDNVRAVKSLKDPKFKRMHCKTVRKLKKSTRKIGMRF